MFRRKRFWLGVGLVGMVAWMSLPSRLDGVGVLPILASMQQPFSSVKVEYYLDGGSIGLCVVDAAGRTNMFTAPVRPDGKPVYEKLIIGTMGTRKTTGFETVALDAKTKEFLCRVMERENDGGGSSALARLSIRGNVGDYGRYFIELLKVQLLKLSGG